jgi:hypothetical protein
MQYARMAIDKYHADRGTTVIYEQYGWKGDDFLLGNTLYSASGETAVSGNSDLIARNKLVGPAGGSKQAWIAAANALFAKGSEAQGATVLAGFASVLMRFTSLSEGGAVWSLVTRQSGTGKTTAALGAITIWGQQKGMQIKSIDTVNARSSVLGALCNLPVMFDELQERSPEAARAMVLSFTGGEDRSRLTREGVMKHIEHAWQTIMITTANTSLVDVLASDLPEIEDAAQMRVIELSCSVPEGLAHRRGDELKRNLIENAGWAGQEYIRYLVQPKNRAAAEKLVHDYMQAIYHKTGWDERYRFWVRTLAAIAVAGIITNKLGLLQFDVTRIVKWLIEQMQERIKPKAKNWETSALSMFLDQHGNERLNVPREFKAGRGVYLDWEIREPRSGKVTIRHEADTNKFFISAGILRKWVMENNQNYNELMRSMIKQGVVLDRQRKMTLGAGTKFATGQVYAVVIDGSHPMMSGLPREIVPAELMGQTSAPVPQSSA